MVNPIIRKIGAAMSKTTIPIVKGISFLVIFISLLTFPVALRNSPTADMPNPAPRYKRPAIIVGGTLPKIILEKGKLKAYKEAAKTAKKIAVLYFVFDISVYFTYFII